MNKDANTNDIQDMQDIKKQKEKIITPGQMVMKRFLRNKLAITGVIILSVMFFFAFLGPIFSPYSEYEVFYRQELDHQIYAYSNDSIYALNIADGGVLWIKKLPSLPNAPLVIASDGEVIAPLSDGSFFSVSPDGKIVNESAAMKETYTHEGKVYENLDLQVEDGYLIAYDKETGLKKWDFIGYDSPVKKYLFNDVHGTIYVLCEDNTLHALRAERGTEKWFFELHGEYEQDYPLGEISIKRIDNKSAPSTSHWLGTDNYGHDVFTRLMYGGRISLMVGFVVIFFELALGVLLGGIAGYYGGWVDNLIMRVVDIFNSIPGLPVMLILGSVMISMSVPSQHKIYVLMAVMGILGWAGVARIVRGQILSLREQEFMVATESSGIRPMRKILKHLIPNVIPQLIVIATLGIGSVILTESAMSYLGLGLSRPYASWGNMVDAVNDPIILDNYLFIWIPPGVCILLTVMAFNFIGDGLRDAFDPKMKR